MRKSSWTVSKLLALAFLGASLLNGQEKEPPRFYTEGAFLLWGIQKQPLPVPLITSGTYANPIPGALGESGTKIVLGNESVNMGWMKGFQLTFGSWLDEGRKYGCEASYFLLPKVSKNQSVMVGGEPGDPNFAVPIFDVTGVFGLNGIPGETIYVLLGPFSGPPAPGYQGVFKLHLMSKLQGGELNGLFRFKSGYTIEVDALAGLRYLELDESLYFNAYTSSAPHSPFPFAFTNTYDQFKTGNNFFAGQLGMRTRYTWRKLSLAGSMKMAAGGLRELLRIAGSCQTSNGTVFMMTAGTANQIIPGGIFTQPTNIGSHSRWEFAALIDASIRGDLSLGKYFSAFAAYTFLWLTDSIRPGNQINPNINTTMTGLAEASKQSVGPGTGPIPFGIPGKVPLPSGPVDPIVHFKSRSFWAQGLSFGLSAKF